MDEGIPALKFSADDGPLVSELIVEVKHALLVGVAPLFLEW